MAIQGVLTVTPEQLQSQSTTVSNRLTDMQGRFDDLKALIAGTSAYWTGEASEAHRNLYTARLAKIDEMFARYREQITDLQIMAGVYSEAEAQAAETASTLPMSML